MQILPDHCNGGAEGAICHFVALYGKVLAPLNSQQLLPRAQLFVLPELTAAPATANGKKFFFPQNQMGLEVNSEVIWSFSPQGGWVLLTDVLTGRVRSGL